MGKALNIDDDEADGHQEHREDRREERAERREDRREERADRREDRQERRAERREDRQERREDRREEWADRREEWADRREDRREDRQERREDRREKLEQPVSERKSLARLTKADLFKLGGLVAFVIICVIIFIMIRPLIADLFTEGGTERVVEQIRNAGAAGVAILLALQFLQVVIAFIPGEVVQVAAGMMYGPWWGLLILWVGCFFSSWIVFEIVHRLGAPFVRAMVPEKWMNRLHDFEESDRMNAVVFILFLIPGMPKDVLTYLIPLTDMPRRDFLLTANIARIPGMLMSTLAANGLLEGDYTMSIIIFLVVAAIAVVVLLLGDKIYDRHKEKTQDEREHRREEESAKEDAEAFNED
jgi:uncharacterized membrane protein YdjX (TVP38/TMEM64 family)